MARRNQRIEIRESLEVLSRALAADLADQIAESVAAREICSLALSGGNTPQTLHRILAGEFREQIPWDKIHFFWGDERYVPLDDEQSNFLMAKKTLFRFLEIDDSQIHPVPTQLKTSADAARRYEEEIRKFFGESGPTLDIVLLGLGGDGHTASLFPGNPVLKEQSRLVAPVCHSPKPPPDRITFTYPLINRTRRIHFLVSGAGKAEAVRRCLENEPDIKQTPAAGIAPRSGELVWWLDDEAAKYLLV